MCNNCITDNISAHSAFLNDQFGRGPVDDSISSSHNCVPPGGTLTEQTVRKSGHSLKVSDNYAARRLRTRGRAVNETRVRLNSLNYRPTAYTAQILMPALLQPIMSATQIALSNEHCFISFLAVQLYKCILTRSINYRVCTINSRI